jgi:2-C-methyl-D-erythritol 4-phosphate cytidylyltransferase/2-C-methyl-D-erythritol 2,4-cyclodiphosphate synthase
MNRPGAESLPRLAALVAAAGRSERFGGRKKEFELVGGRSVLDRSISPLLGLENLEVLALTFPQGRVDELLSSLSPGTKAALGDRLLLVEGGTTRRESVLRGLEAIAKALGSADAADVVVLIHDGARPWASVALAERVAVSAAEKGACIPVTSLVDTPKEIGEGGNVESHPRRSSFVNAQTPQGFRLTSILEAHRRAAAEGYECTDDAELYDRYIGPVATTPGEEANRKITFPEDLPAARGPAFRVGLGWDIHRLVAGRKLLLGGVEIPFELGEEGHSDGDALLHAVIDALLGAAALGDIGMHFPPSDETWRGADSRGLAARAVALVREAGWEPGNLDCTVVLERPRLWPYREAMRESIAACLGLDPALVSVKAKTKEGLDAAGEGLAVEAQAIAILFPR